jgi:putative ABC transport system ATP-binding protein
LITVIELHNVRKVFNSGKPNEFTAVDGVNLTIDSRKATALKGSSGSGKTTLLTILGCMARPTSGRIMLDEREITSLPERFLTQIRRKTFGFMFQHFNLIKGMSALENVMLPAYPDGERHSLLKKRAMDLIALFNLSHKASMNVEWLSGGEAQRIAIARALINKPSIIIADEPTAHLDTNLSRELMETMRQLKSEGKTIIIASHDPIVYDSDVIDRTVSMRDGKVVSPGSGA